MLRSASYLVSNSLLLGVQPHLEPAESDQAVASTVRSWESFPRQCAVKGSACYQEVVGRIDIQSSLASVKHFSATSPGIDHQLMLMMMLLM